MRESKAPAVRPPRALVALSVPLVDAFAIADQLIVVDGEEVRLGDYWGIARYQSAIASCGVSDE